MVNDIDNMTTHSGNGEISEMELVIPTELAPKDSGKKVEPRKEEVKQSPKDSKKTTKKDDENINSYDSANKLEQKYKEIRPDLFDDDEENDDEDEPTDLDKKEAKQQEKTSRRKEEKKESKPDVEVDYNAMLQWESDKGLFQFEIPKDFDGSEDSYIALKEQEKIELIKSEVEAVLEQVDVATDGAISHWKRGGNIKDYAQVMVNNYSKIKEDDVVDNPIKQEQLVRDYLKRFTRYSDEKIEKTIARYKTLEELEDEAKNALPDLKAWEQEEIKNVEKKTKEKAVQEETNRKEMYNKMNTVINSTDNFIGVKVSPQAKKKAQDYLEKGVTLDKINKDLVKYLPTLALLDVYGVLDGDAKELVKRLESNVTKDVKERIKQMPFTKANNRMVERDDNSETVDKIGKMFEGYI